MKGKIEPGNTGGWYAYYWDEEKNKWVLIFWYLTKFMAKRAIKRLAKRKNMQEEVFEV